MSDLSLPPPRQEHAELALANRKLTSALLGMTLLAGLIACMSYLAGRTVTQMKAEAATVTRTEIPAPPVVVTPLEKPSPLAPTAEVPQPVLAPAPAPRAAAAAGGESYLQVGYVNPATETYLQDNLKQRGYTFRLTPMENSPNARVLVGPVRNIEEQAALEARLRQDGFQYFLRRL